MARIEIPMKDGKYIVEVMECKESKNEYIKSFFEPNQKDLLECHTFTLVCNGYTITKKCKTVNTTADCTVTPPILSCDNGEC